MDATYVPLLQSGQDNEPLIIKYSPGETADFGGHYTALRKRTPTATLEEEEPTLRMAEGALGHEMCCMYSCSVVCGGEFAKKCTLCRSCGVPDDLVPIYCDKHYKAHKNHKPGMNHPRPNFGQPKPMPPLPDVHGTRARARTLGGKPPHTLHTA